MICPNCKKQINDDSSFCQYCGSKIVVENKCPHCGAHPLPKDSKFCPDCGHRIEQKQNSLPIMEFAVGSVSFKMIRVEGGTFRMGSNDSEAYNDEKSIHDVTLSDYYIGQTQVTQALWKAVMGSNPSKWNGDNLPVEQVSWYYCQTFINKLNSITGKSFRLPTEAEWEFAARGGNNSRGYKYSGSNYIDNVAWYASNSNNKTHPVATKQPNELGIYDMSGNVKEWCSDWYSYYSSSVQTNPQGENSGSIRVCRGGCWCNSTRDCRSSSRSYDNPDYGVRLGLRLVLVP